MLIKAFALNLREYIDTNIPNFKILKIISFNFNFLLLYVLIL